MGKRRRRIPEWARRQRLDDMAWVLENLHVFWPAAQEQYAEQGRGAIVVDTTVQPEGESGHPFTYFDEAKVAETADGDAERMVREYDPETEIVIAMLKEHERVSVYRVQVPQEAREGLSEKEE